MWSLRHGCTTTLGGSSCRYMSPHACHMFLRICSHMYITCPHMHFTYRMHVTCSHMHVTYMSHVSTYMPHVSTCMSHACHMSPHACHMSHMHVTCHPHLVPISLAVAERRQLSVKSAGGSGGAESTRLSGLRFSSTASTNSSHGECKVRCTLTLSSCC